MILVCNAIEKITPCSYADLPCVEVKLINVLTVWNKSVSANEREIFIDCLGKNEILDAIPEKQISDYLENKGYTVTKK